MHGNEDYVLPLIGMDEIMIYLVIIFLTCAFLLFVSLRFMKVGITSPVFLTLLSWSIMSFFGYLSYDSFDAFREESFYCLMIWIVITSFVYMSVENAQRIKSRVYVNYIPNRLCSRYSLFVIPACAITAYEIYKVGSGGPVNFLLNLRLANIEDDYPYETFTFMPSFYPIVMAMFASICLFKSRLIDKISIFAWLVLFAIGTMGKFAVITPIMMFITIYEMKRGLSKKRLAVMVPVVLSLMLVMHFYRMSDGDSSSIAYVFGTYIYSPIIAFGHLIDSGINWSGDYTLRFVHAIAFKSGLSGDEPVKTILDYAYVPTPTNVYTVMQPFYSDMGYYGVILGAIIYGVMLSAVYSMAKLGNLLMLAFYSILSIGIITEFFSETIITNISGNIKMLICMAIVFKFFTRRIPSKTGLPRDYQEVTKAGNVV